MHSSVSAEATRSHRTVAPPSGPRANLSRSLVHYTRRHFYQRGLIFAFDTCTMLSFSHKATLMTASMDLYSDIFSSFSFVGRPFLLSNGSPYATGPLSCLAVCLVCQSLVYCGQTVGFGWIKCHLVQR